MTIHPTSSINQSWDTLDNLGNWKSFSEDADGAGAGSNLNQSRTVNAANELTGISGTGMNWVDPTYDAAGNMTNMPIPGDETNDQDAIYDAWNHLISIEQNSTAVGVYEYDGLGRRIQKLTDTILGSNATEHIYFNEKWQILETVVGGQTYESFTWDPRYIDAPIARYRNANIGNDDGSLDTTFDSDGKVTTDFGSTDEGRRVVTQTDGKIVIAGSTGSLNSNFAVARYNLDGSLDTSFDTDGKVTTDFGGSETAYALALQSDGKIVVVGGNVSDTVIARYNTNGSLDTSFDTDGKLTLDVSGASTSDKAYDVYVSSSGSIFVAATVGTTCTLVKLTSSGAYDTSFDTDGKVSINTVTGFSTNRTVAMAIDSSDRIALAGQGSGNDFGIARLTSAGALDTTFDSDGVRTVAVGSNDDARSLAIQSDGKIVVAGKTKDVGGGSTNAIGVIRLNDDGSLDTSFDTDGIAYYDSASAEVGEFVVVDLLLGDIYITGTQGSDIIVARFTKSGALDTTWFDGDGVVVTNFGGSDNSTGLALQNDGKIVITGSASGNVALARYLTGLNEHTFYTYDANYNVTASLDRYGVVLERYTYTPYGKRTVIDEDWSSDTDGISDIKNNFGHQGGIIDGESFLMKFRHRDLHVSLGNWTERDPVGYADGTHLTAYVRNRPTFFQDPTGLVGQKCSSKCDNCWQTCMSADGQAILNANLAGGAVIWRPDGCRCACVNNTSYPPSSDPANAAMRACVIVHEEEHVNQGGERVRCDTASGLCLQGPAAGQQMAAECAAAAAEIACLTSKKSTCGTDTNCVSKIDEQIDGADDHCTDLGGHV